MHLTKKQKQIYDFLNGFINEHGYAPSIAEIGEHFGLSSPATIHKHLTNLEAKGLIQRHKNMSRAIEMPHADVAPSVVEAPLLGEIVAGAPVRAYDDATATISIPEDMVGRNRTYVLKVRGESMIEDAIRDGDMVIVDERSWADNGETVVALIDNESATLKRYYREGKMIRLQPANAAMAPIMVEEERLTIQGVVIGLIRKFNA
jgi:repressor LexA